MTENLNPFALIRASDYTDAQINSLWVELGAKVINAIIEPRSRDSKYILGGKGTGKTHLLRYHSYSAVRLRAPKKQGVEIIAAAKVLAVFVRAAGFDASRFDPPKESAAKWQQLFGVYLELRLVEGVLDALNDIKKSSPDSYFDDAALLQSISRSVHDPEILQCQTLSDFSRWVDRERRGIDDAVNNSAFNGELNVRVAFAIGGLCIPLGRALAAWNECFLDVPLIYLVDEIENFSISQQEVVNTLIRYGEGQTTFRMTGRLYSRKTLSTIANGEENREGSEFRTIVLDEVLRSYQKYPQFARQFVAKRLGIIGIDNVDFTGGGFDPKLCFEEIDGSDFYAKPIASLGIADSNPQFVKHFRDALFSLRGFVALSGSEIDVVVDGLTAAFPLLLQKLNILIFCKRFTKKSKALAVAMEIKNMGLEFLKKESSKRDYYATAYGHYAIDLFAQLCRESSKLEKPLYAGFDSFVKMSSGNPRNLLVVLGRLYEIATFKGMPFMGGAILPISMQSQAAIEAARFMFERDTNYGSQSDLAREGVSRLASLLRVARYALSIPEVSPLAVSFADSDLTKQARKILNSALNYSLIFEIQEGRPDRNSQLLLRKIQLNPVLSPRWGLPVARRGDLSLTKDLLNAIFDPELEKDFEALLRTHSAKWNMPLKGSYFDISQSNLFEND
ncbi:hypothetical protein CLU95_3820 [Variovorax sp. 54]|uniref:ORC-CDC6 family AAA ATPase n=1 Tax=Variovorax sp. 54 TaxID=2035212 RepID=UPI000C187633|nr:hypothetical protein [Variovorax sp. 54]PIF76652.1 hypothetical protein CLU95_3820 [Variovorax sp. 54]